MIEISLYIFHVNLLNNQSNLIEISGSNMFSQKKKTGRILFVLIICFVGFWGYVVNNINNNNNNNNKNNNDDINNSNDKDNHSDQRVSLPATTSSTGGNYSSQKFSLASSPATAESSGGNHSKRVYSPAFSKFNGGNHSNERDTLITTTASVGSNHSGSASLPVCPPIPGDLLGTLPVSKQRLNISIVEANYSRFFQRGGFYAPPDCRAAQRLAIVIPFRDREQHLTILLNHLLPILIRQRREFKASVTISGPIIG